MPHILYSFILFYYDWSKVTVKTFMKQQKKYYISTKCCFEFCLSNNPEKKCITVSTKILSNFFNIDNKDKYFLSTNQYIQIISELKTMFTWFRWFLQLLKGTLLRSHSKGECEFTKIMFTLLSTEPFKQTLLWTCDGTENVWNTVQVKMTVWVTTGLGFNWELISCSLWQ